MTDELEDKFIKKIIENYQKRLLERYNVQDINFEDWIDNLYKENYNMALTITKYGFKKSITKTKCEDIENDFIIVEKKLNYEHADTKLCNNKNIIKNTEFKNTDTICDQKSDLYNYKLQQRECDNKVENEIFQETIRGNKRKILEGTECFCCKKYFEDNKKTLKKNSRHKQKYKKAETPPSFYDLDF
ncbi:hypothetical protein GVAV_001140 [Gurleya vavrai]